MKLCYRGVFYKHYPSHSVQSETACESVQILRYRGVFYRREIPLAQRATPKEPWNSRLTSTGAVQLSNDRTESDINNGNAIQIQQMGCLIQALLYWLENGSLTRVEGENTRLQHYLARLHRKTLCYSKSVEMLKCSLRLLLHYLKYRTVPLSA